MVIITKNHKKSLKSLKSLVGTGSRFASFSLESPRALTRTQHTADHVLVAAERLPRDIGHRLRRRGPRSACAVARRCLRRGPAFSVPVSLPLPLGDSCRGNGFFPLSNSFFQDSSRFTLFHINLRGFISHTDELSAILEAEGWPTYVGITESKLTDNVKDPVLHGYCRLSS